MPKALAPVVHRDSRFSSPMLGHLKSRVLLSAALVVLLATTAEAIICEDGFSDVKPLGDYRRDLKSFMKLSKADDEPRTQRAAIYNLCELHHQVVNDPRFPQSQKLQGMRVVIANRLEGYAKDFRNQQARIKRKMSPGARDAANDASLAAKSEEKSESSDLQEDADLALAQSFQTQSSITGGPAYILNHGGRFAPPWDHGWQLVDLIENTIHPDAWRNNGGNAAIHYFQPLRVLVIGASSQVHEDTLDLLWKLRANQ